MAGLSLAVGVALAEALHARGFERVRLKWPNDLWVDGRKLGGILVQLRGNGAQTSAVIGIGVNVRMPAEAAEAIDQPWCDLSQLSPAPVSRNEVLSALLAGLLPALADFEEQGLGAFSARWQVFDALAGQPVLLSDGDRQHAGTCLGIAGDGALRLLDDRGVERLFHGGETRLRPA